MEIIDIVNKALRFEWSALLERFINYVYNNFHPVLQFTWKISKTSVSFLDILVSIIGNRLITWGTKTCTSFPNLTLSTLLALMNVLVTFNAHLSLSDTLAIDSPSFLFFTPFCPVSSHCLVLYFVIRFTFLCLHFVLMKSVWLALILSRDVFVLTHIKTRIVFPDPHY